MKLHILSSIGVKSLNCYITSFEKLYNAYFIIHWGYKLIVSTAVHDKTGSFLPFAMQNDMDLASYPLLIFFAKHCAFSSKTDNFINIDNIGNFQYWVNLQC